MRATCFGCKTAIIGPMQNIYKVQYKCALSSVYFTEYRHTQHHSATHLGYKFRLNISHHQACSLLWFCVRRYSVKQVLNKHNSDESPVPPMAVLYFLTELLTLLTYLPTPWSRVHLEKLTGSQLAKEFLAFYGI